MPISNKFSFTGAQGDQLAARIDSPEDPKAYALFAHCFTCGKDSVAASRVAAALAREGIATVRFDFTGLGSSDGDFANTNFTSNVDDLVKAADHMRETLQAPSLLIGHSLGGAAVLAAAGDIPEVKAVATIGAPADPAHVAHNFEEDKYEIVTEGEKVVNLGGRNFRIRKQFLDDIAEQPQVERIKNMKKALLVLHSPIDSFVGIENAGAIFQAAKHPKSFVSLDNAHHLLFGKRDADYAAEVISQWAVRYLDLAAEDKPKPLPEGVVEVEENLTTRLAQNIRVGSHELTADEPISVPGGNDSGPTPYDFLLSGLGACTAMTVRMYAELKKLPLTRVRVRLQHEKRGEGAKKIDYIHRRIHFEGDLDATVRAKLLEIANKCPVHRTLHNEIEVETIEDTDN